MKRALAALSVLIMIFTAFLPFGRGPEAAVLMRGSTDAASPAEGDGLYTAIPYVPKYSGELSSQSRVILMDLATGNILIEQNGDVRAYPGSTTKIMTAVLLIENTADDEWDIPLAPLTEVNSEDSEKGSQMGLKIGDQPTRRDLLYGLLLPSGCDCAYVVSQLIAGTEAQFVFMMNVRASEIGMYNTGYENSYGLAYNGHYTTAEDMATLVRHAMQYKLFRSTVSTAKHTVSFKNGGSTRSVQLYNTNYLIRTDSPYYYGYAIGIKTGTTTFADHCLTSAARKNGLELAAVVMNSDNNDERYTFSKELLEWGFRYYASEGGYYSMTLTNALFKAGPLGCGIYSVPDSAQQDSVASSTLPAGTAMRVGAYRYDNNGTLWYMVWCGDSFRWARSVDMEFVCYINDIKLETGSALCGTVLQGEDKTIDSVLASRHLVKAVTVTIYNEEGIPVTGGSNYPAASCTHTFAGTTLDSEVDLGILPPGKYTCVTHVEAVAYVPDAPDREYFSVDESSTILVAGDSVGTDVDGSPLFEEYPYSYNANTGSDAPEGGSARLGSAFTVSSGEPTKPGCAFAGWNTKPDGSGTSYKAGDMITVKGAVTLYAMWEAGSDEWHSSLDANIVGGRLMLTGSITNPIGITGAELTVKRVGEDEPLYSGAAAIPVNTIYAEEFAYDLSTLDLTDGKYVIELSASSGVSDRQKVYEQQVEVTSRPVYTLLLVPNGGAVDGSTDGLTVVYGESFGELPTAHKEGCTFLGWYDNDENRITADTPVPESANGIIVLHANWSDGETVTPEPGQTPPAGNSFLNAIPLWVWFAAGLIVVAGLITLIVIIIRRPDGDDEDDEEETEDVE